MRKRKTFTYDVVSQNGAGILASGYRTMSGARKAAERISRDANWGLLELVRVEHIDGVPGSWPRIYWIRQRTRWVAWDARRDASVRHPDPCWLPLRRADTSDSDGGAA